jgi:nitronate monooxygenase
MRDRGARDNDIDRMQAWSGQSAGLARAEPAADIVAGLWHDAVALLG